MATLKQKIRAEQAARAMVEHAGIRQPEHIEYGHACIRLLWQPERVCVVIEIDNPPEDFETVGDCLDAFEDIRDYLDDQQAEGHDEAA